MERTLGNTKKGDSEREQQSFMSNSSDRFRSFFFFFHLFQCPRRRRMFDLGGYERQRIKSRRLCPLVAGVLSSAPRLLVNV